MKVVKDISDWTVLSLNQLSCYFSFCLWTYGSLVLWQYAK